MARTKTETIELSVKEVQALYQFALNRIAKIVLSANPGSGIYQRAVKVMKAKDQPAEVFGFIKYYNRLLQRKNSASRKQQTV